MRSMIAALSLAALGYMAGASNFGGFGIHAPHTPHLIGHGCLGAGGDIFADEESDFPVACRAIEGNGK